MLAGGIVEASMTLSTHTKRTTCRGCGGGRLRNFLELGPTPPANSILHSTSEFSGEATYPLDVYFCETCSLMQLLDVVKGESEDRNHSSCAVTSHGAAAETIRFAQSVVGLLGLGGDDVVVEIGSKDGSLLSRIRERRCHVIGLEPARKLAALARSRGIETITEPFTSSISNKLRNAYGPASAVIADNILSKVDDTQDFLQGCRTLLKPGGFVVLKVPYVREILSRLQFDCIYHEELCYFSVTSLMRLCETAGLSIVHMEYYPEHGGWLRMYAGLANGVRDHAPEVGAFARREATAGLGSLETYERFAIQVGRNREKVRSFLEHVRNENISIAGYGAVPKGNALLNYCKVGTSLLPYIADHFASKPGVYTPGMHIPVFPVSALLERQPDYVLILASEFAEEIVQKNAEYIRRGGRFFVPLPEPHVFEDEAAYQTCAV